MSLLTYWWSKQTRDFVNVHVMVEANILSTLAPGITGAFNIGSGTRVTINDLAKIPTAVSGRQHGAIHCASRLGDVRHSLADISGVRMALGFIPRIEISTGIYESRNWAKQVMPCSKTIYSFTILPPHAGNDLLLGKLAT